MLSFISGAIEKKNCSQGSREISSKCKAALLQELQYQSMYHKLIASLVEKRDTLPIYLFFIDKKKLYWKAPKKGASRYTRCIQQLQKKQGKDLGRDQQESADPKEEAQPEKHRSTKNQHGKEEDTNLAYENFEEVEFGQMDGNLERNDLEKKSCKECGHMFRGTKERCLRTRKFSLVIISPMQNLKQN